MATLGQIIIAVCAVIAGMIGVCWWIYPRKTRQGDPWELEPEPMKPVDRRFREAQGYE